MDENENATGADLGAIVVADGITKNPEQRGANAATNARTTAPTAVRGRVHPADHARVQTGVPGQDRREGLVNDHPGLDQGKEQSTGDDVLTRVHVHDLKLRHPVKMTPNAARNGKTNTARGTGVAVKAGAEAGTENGRREKERNAIKRYGVQVLHMNHTGNLMHFRSRRRKVHQPHNGDSTE